MLTTATLLAALLAVAVRPSTPSTPAAPPDPAPPALYAIAVQVLLERTDADEVYLLPTSADAELRVRPRRASGPARTASLATAREVAGLLRNGASARGAAVRGARARLVDDDAVQVVLGELRFEPEASPSFARLRLAVVGTDGTRQLMDFLLKREGARWRALKMEAADNIGLVVPVRGTTIAS